MALDLSSTPKAPPRRNAGPRKPAETKPNKQAQRMEGTQGVLQAATLACILSGNYADAGAISKHGPGVMSEAVKLAETNEPVAKVVDFLCLSGPLAGLIAAALPLGLQIAANHGWISSQALVNTGMVVAPDALAMEVQADLARNAADAMASQAANEAVIRDLQKDMQPA